jgi:hypothetical protein
MASNPNAGAKGGSSGRFTDIPTITKDNAKETFTSNGFGGAPQPNPEAITGGEPVTNGDGASKYTTGYERRDQDNPNATTSGSVPPSGVTENPRGGGRHTGYVVNEAKRGISTEKVGLVNKSARISGPKGA